MVLDDELMGLDIEGCGAAHESRYQLLPDIPALLLHFAQSMAGQIRARNERREPTRLTLPVGPVAHYRRLVDIMLAGFHSSQPGARST